MYLPPQETHPMARRQLYSVLGDPRHLTGASVPGGSTDKQLLERFLSDRDETAFETLMQRHAPMVLAVCRRVLGASHDADDAFQATFLVLIRRAAGIPWRDSPGGWLHGVAYRTAI